MYILTHFLTSQPALIKLDNENIGGHLTPLQLHNIYLLYLLTSQPLGEVEEYMPPLALSTLCCTLQPNDTQSSL